MNVPMTDAELIEKLEKERLTLSLSRKRVERLSQRTLPPNVQEIVIAQRAIEDARMRLGVALARIKGHDPWANEIKEAK